MKCQWLNPGSVYVGSHCPVLSIAVFLKQNIFIFGGKIEKKKKSCSSITATQLNLIRIFCHPLVFETSSEIFCLPGDMSGLALSFDGRVTV